MGYTAYGPPCNNPASNPPLTIPLMPLFSPNHWIINLSGSKILTACAIRMAANIRGIRLKNETRASENPFSYKNSYLSVLIKV